MRYNDFIFLVVFLLIQVLKIYMYEFIFSHIIFTEYQSYMYAKYKIHHLLNTNSNEKIIINFIDKVNVQFKECKFKI